MKGGNKGKRQPKKHLVKTHAKALRVPVREGTVSRSAEAESTPRSGSKPAMNGDYVWIANFIWGIADDVLRDLYVRGKYRDVILPMTVLRRLDAVLEPTKQAVLAMKETLDKAKVVNQDAPLRRAAG
jgi:hypothetical protein